MTSQIMNIYMYTCTHARIHKQEILEIKLVAFQNFDLASTNCRHMIGNANTSIKLVWDLNLYNIYIYIYYINL